MITTENELTIIVPTHNNVKRACYIDRCLDYFSTFPYQVILCDSSVDKHVRSCFADNVNYMHLPNMRFSEKMVTAIKSCNSTYVACCADDDFLLLEGIIEAISVLNESENSTVACGNKYAYHIMNSEVQFMTGKKQKKYEQNFKTAEERVESFVTNYKQILWSVFRKDILLDSYEAIEKAKFDNDNFIELCMGTLCSAKGKVVRYNGLLSVRRFNNEDNWGSRHKAINDSLYNKKDYLSFCRVLEPLVGERIPPLAFDAYVHGNQSSFLTRIISRLIAYCSKKNVAVIRDTDTSLKRIEQHIIKAL